MTQDLTKLREESLQVMTELEEAALLRLKEPGITPQEKKDLRLSTLQEPHRTLLKELWEALVTRRGLGRPEGETFGAGFARGRDYAMATLEELGLARLASPSFWDAYHLSLDDLRDPLAAMYKAAWKTPHLEEPRS